ncbi:MAG: outer membrane protein assembly factor BamE [Rhizobiales bacterium]|nr:outer membrane protein assembly factor BamE [Hyphomicrobiales bacterium]
MERFLVSRILNSGLIWGGIVASSIVLPACNASSLKLNGSETLHQGYVIDEQQLELVPVGSSREQVILALGSPSTTATFDNEVFYYISQTRKRSVAFQNPRLVDQRILAVYFGPDSRVTQIANYGLKDGRVFDFISRTTPTGGKDQSFIGQVLQGTTGGVPGPVNPQVPGTASP